MGHGAYRRRRRRPEPRHGDPQRHAGFVLRRRPVRERRRGRRTGLSHGPPGGRHRRRRRRIDQARRHAAVRQGRMGPDRVGGPHSGQHPDTRLGGHLSRRDRQAGGGRGRRHRQRRHRRARRPLHAQCDRGYRMHLHPSAQSRRRGVHGRPRLLRRRRRGGLRRTVRFDRPGDLRGRRRLPDRRRPRLRLRQGRPAGLGPGRPHGVRHEPRLPGARRGLAQALPRRDRLGRGGPRAARRRHGRHDRLLRVPRRVGGSRPRGGSLPRRGRGRRQAAPR